MTIKWIRHADTRAEAMDCGCLSLTGASRQRRRRRWRRQSKSVFVLSAVVLLDGLVPCSGFKNSAYSGVGAASQAPQLSGSTSWTRCRRSRRCTNFNVFGDHRKDPSSRSIGAAGPAVHTLLIDNYDSYTYNLFQLLSVVNGQAPFVVFNDDDDGDLWRAIERMGRIPDNIVISPGPGRPDVPKDFGMCSQALSEAADIPILGVCLGHEGLGIVHGAEVIRAAEPMHGRLSPIFHDEDALFRDVPQGSRVVRYHSLVVDRDTLPAGGALKATAWTGDGVLMAMRHEERPHWGVQFHPESVGTKHGSVIVQNFRDLTVAWQRAGAVRKNSSDGGNGEGWSKEGSSGMARNGWARRVAAGESAAVGVGDIGIGIDNPSVFAPVKSETETETADGDTMEPGKGVTKLETRPPPADRRDLDGLLPSAGRHRRRQRLVLHVEEVEMARGAQEGGGDERIPDNSSRTASREKGSTTLDPEYVFRALYGDDPTAWWLDSSSQRPGLAVNGQAKARFSFMGGADGPLSQIVECYGKDRLVVQRGGGRSEAGGKARQEIRANIMDYLKSEMAKINLGQENKDDIIERVALDDGDDVNSNPNRLEIRSASARMGGGDAERGVVLPFDFMGGFVGFLGYELRHEANDVLERSVGGTEWDWQPPGGGRWEDVSFDGEEVEVEGVKDCPSVQADGLASEAQPRGANDATPAAAGPGSEGGDGGGDGVGDVPLGFLVFVDRFIAFDHQEGKAYVLALSRADDAVEDDALDWIKHTAASLRGLSSSSRGVGDGDGVAADGVAAEGINTIPATACAMDVPRSRYEQSLEEIMRLVEEGETYEVCLTNQIVCERPKGDGDGAVVTPPLDLYSRLRRSNPAPYAAFIRHDPHRRLSPASGRHDVSREGQGQEVGVANGGPAFAVCCSSPEKFLKVDGQGWVESKPIKGTVKRGKTPAEDLILATNLAKGEKNMAENLMIVDLVRNDLGRVCQIGSVSVPKLMHVESYATVHQLVSTVRGRLRPDCGALDAIAAAFPGGSMTGAPKQRTMAIIDRLEQGRSRGVYSGSIGYLGVNGAADFNIVIRTAVVTPQNATVGAGGAVIALSEVDDEYEEMLLKATSVLGALGHGTGTNSGRRGPPGSEVARSRLRPPSSTSVSKPKVAQVPGNEKGVVHDGTLPP